MNELGALADLMTRHTRGDGAHTTSLPGVTLIRASRPSEPLHVLHEPALCVIVQGSKKVLMGDRHFRYDRAHCLIVSVSLPVVGEILEGSPGEPYLCIRLDLDQNVLRDLLSDVGLPDAPDTAPSTGLTLQPVTADLLEAFLRLLRLLETPEDIPVLSPLAQREILYRTLKHGAAAPFLQIAAGNGRLLQINRVVNWLKENFAAPFDLRLLTEEARMSSSTLHQHFKTVTGMTPLQYQKQLRLQEARRLLQGQTVSAESAGHAVGYESASQFSREYRRLFGAPPLRDVLKLT